MMIEAVAAYEEECFVLVHYRIVCASGREGGGLEGQME